jgi:hypothetical protein
MSKEILIMLTHNDMTVKNAAEIFAACKDLPVPFWGFKDVGIPTRQMVDLNLKMKEAGKTTFLEVVSYTEKECIEAANLAYECGFDYLTGTVYYPSVLEAIKDAPIKYYPFCGKVGGSPVELKGTIDEIVADSKRLLEAGVDGVDLVAYRYVDGDPVELMKAVVSELGNDKVMIAGSINSVARIKLMADIKPYAYTMGGALFESKFVENGGFRENLEAVIKIINEGEK